LATRSIRILVADDFEPWRRRIRSILETRPELGVIAEVGDGLETVQKAQELKPDLILLDIGLPHLDGLEAANRIRQITPDAAIIFLTQNSDQDLIPAGFRTGAQGYVLKAEAVTELLPAIEQALRDKRER